MDGEKREIEERLKKMERKRERERERERDREREINREIVDACHAYIAMFYSPLYIISTTHTVCATQCMNL